MICNLKYRRFRVIASLLSTRTHSGTFIFFLLFLMITGVDKAFGPVIAYNKCLLHFIVYHLLLCFNYMLFVIHKLIDITNYNTDPQGKMWFSLEVSFTLGFAGVYQSKNGRDWMQLNFRKHLEKECDNQHQISPRKFLLKIMFLYFPMHSCCYSWS